MTKKERPRHLALHQIKLPLPGLVSILHRISGLMLFVSLPLLLLAFQYSLNSIETHARLMEVLAHPLSKLAMLGLLWAFLHHFCAGIRYLLIDLRIGSGLAGARNSSKAVLAASLLSAIAMGVMLW